MTSLNTGQFSRISWTDLGLALFYNSSNQKWAHWQRKVFCNSQEMKASIGWVVKIQQDIFSQLGKSEWPSCTFGLSFSTTLPKMGVSPPRTDSGHLLSHALESGTHSQTEFVLTPGGQSTWGKWPQIFLRGERPFRVDDLTQSVQLVGHYHNLECVWPSISPNSWYTPAQNSPQ